MKQRVLLWLILAILATGCNAPQPSAAPMDSSSPAAPAGAPAKKRIVAAIRGEPHTLSSVVNSAGPGGVAGVSEVEHLVHVGLPETDRATVLGPRLAEAVPSIENNLWKVFPDGRMELTWTIRPNVRWHDGTPFTTDDLLFAARVGQDREVALLRDRAYDSIASIEARDARTVVVNWRRTYILADTMFSEFALPLPKHLLETAFNDDKANFLTLPYWTSEFVGTGPFKLKEWAQSSHMVLEANPEYTLGRPKLDEIEVRFFLDPNVVIANLLSGSVDLTLGRGFSFEQALQVREQWRDGGIDLNYMSWIALFPQFINPSPAVVGDVRFRRAMLHAIDRQQLTDSFLAGTVPVPHGYLGPNDAYAKSTESRVVRYDFDPARAAQLVEALGYTKGPDGAFRDAAGQCLAIEIRTTAGDDLRDKLLFGASSHLQQAGIGVETVVIPRQRAEDSEYRVTKPGFEMIRQPNDMSEGALRRFLSRESALPENNFRAQNRTRYQNPELDALIERFLVTIPMAERTELAGHIVQHVTENLPILGLTYGVEAMLIPSKLQNVTAATDTRNAHEWTLR